MKEFRSSQTLRCIKTIQRSVLKIQTFGHFSISLSFNSISKMKPRNLHTKKHCKGSYGLRITLRNWIRWFPRSFPVLKILSFWWYYFCFGMRTNHFCTFIFVLSFVFFIHILSFSSFLLPLPHCLKYRVTVGSSEDRGDSVNTNTEITWYMGSLLAQGKRQRDS